MFAALTPHPPLLVPQIGQEKRERVAATVAAMETLARRIVAQQPDVVLMVTPHGPSRRDALTLLQMPIQADFLHFKLGWNLTSDAVLGNAIAHAVRTVPWTSTRHHFSSGLDHALMVPLYFLKAAGLDAAVVCLSVCAADHREHCTMGEAIGRVVRQSPARIALVCSGDLSHRLLPEAPAGFDPQGRIFDDVVVESLRTQNWQALLNLDAEMIRRAGECGLRPIGLMTGVLKDAPSRSEVLAYEGPFGVGYCTAAFEGAA